MSRIVAPTVLRHPLGEPVRFEMHCDAPMPTPSGRCPIEPKWAPRLIVPSKDWAPGLRPLRMMTTLHFCLMHWDRHAPKVADLLDAKRRGEFEQVARTERPAGFVPDFDAAFVERVLVTTPEYRAFLNALAGKVVARV